jgi:hypothetical protein
LKSELIDNFMKEDLGFLPGDHGEASAKTVACEILKQDGARWLKEMPSGGLMHTVSQQTRQGCCEEDKRGA